MATIWCNGEWLNSDGSAVLWSDRGLLHGLGLFETLLAVEGRPVHVEAHLARLQQGLERFAWSMALHNLEVVMSELLERNGLTEGRSRIRWAMTGGSGELRDLRSGKDRLFWMTAEKLRPAPMELRLGFSPWRRNEHSALVGLKCASYAENLVALDWAQRLGFDEALFLNTAGELCEAATANLFLVRGGVLLTPELKSGCLPGVARARILGLASKLGIKTGEKALMPEDLKQAEECFLSSATRGVMPVSLVGERELGVGPLSARLAEAWERVIGES